MQGISLSDLTAMGQQEQKQLLGEHLFRSVISIDPQFHDMDLAGKITGMLLEMDNADILHLLESQDALREKVQEAIAVLEAHKRRESMASPTRTVKYSSVVKNHPTLQGMQISIHYKILLQFICCGHVFNWTLIKFIYIYIYIYI